MDCKSVLLWTLAACLLPAADAARSADGYDVSEKYGQALIRVQLDRVKVALSGEMRLTLAIEGKSPLQVKPIEALTASKDWTVSAVSQPVMTPLPDDRVRWEQRFRLGPEADGALALPLNPLHFRTGDSAQATEVSWPTIAVQVTTDVANVSLNDLRDIRSIEPVPQPTPWPMWMLPVGVGLTALLLGAWKLGRRWGPGAVELPADQWALQELDRLAASDLPAAGEIERFHVRLSDLLRTYLGKRFGARASEQTTQEFLTALPQSSLLPVEQHEQLRRLFERCDLAKFARALYPPEECQTAILMAREFVVQTAQAAPAAAPAAANSP